MLRKVGEMKFILLIGLPGSGKTHYGNATGLPFLDDVTQNGGVKAVRNFVETANSDTVVLSDYSFIFPDELMRAETVLRGMWPGSKFEYIVFANDPEQCWKNVQRRQDGRVITRDALMVAAKYFKYPDGATFVPVFSTK